MALTSFHFYHDSKSSKYRWYVIQNFLSTCGVFKTVSNCSFGSFPFVPPPSLVGAYYLQPPDARAIFLHNDLLCNDTCSVTGGA